VNEEHDLLEQRFTAWWLANYMQFFTRITSFYDVARVAWMAAWEARENGGALPPVEDGGVLLLMESNHEHAGDLDHEVEERAPKKEV